MNGLVHCVEVLIAKHYNKNHYRDKTDWKALPKFGSEVWALFAHWPGSVCPSLGLSMPTAWSLCAHGLVLYGS